MRNVSPLTNETSNDQDSDDDRIVRKSGKRRKRNHFLDDEAECDDMIEDDNEVGANSDDNDFIDDTEMSQWYEEVDSNARKEKRMNQMALFAYLKELTNQELENIGLKFDLTTVENIFE